MSMMAQPTYQKSWSTGCNLTMISATGFLLEFHRHKAARHDRQITGRFPGVHD
jgi:hypothetical protein